ncbi:enterotoxin A family protein [Leptospira weilii]|uniref:enterotoxin A family protein n=1 Tax=Leptospira weilii TaxID=28184 RepID=UPI0007731AE4|nr:enterotoxin A family protein [Leptospira weilii]
MKKILMILIGSFLFGTIGNLYARRGRVIANPVDIVEAPYQSQVSSPPVESFYRADMLDPEQLRGSDGFWSAGMSTAPGNSDRSLFNHVTLGAHTGRSAYISATRALSDAHIFGNSNIPQDYYIYQIAGAPNIFDVQRSLGPYTPSHARGDVVALFRITWGQVYGWYRVSFGVRGEFVHNPMFDRGRYGTTTSSTGYPELAGFPQGDPRWGNRFFANVARCDHSLRSSNGRCYLRDDKRDVDQKIYDKSYKKSKIPSLPIFKTPISKVASSKGVYLSLSSYLSGLCYVTSKTKIECRSILNNGKLSSIKETAISDTGYENSYMFGDINNDQKNDFCRLVAAERNSLTLLKCNLGDGNGRFPNEVNFGALDGGWASRGAADKRVIVKGIFGKAYFCRIVNGYEMACTELVRKNDGSGFAVFTQGETKKTNGSYYYSDLVRQESIFTDSNQDGIPDWCKVGYKAGDSQIYSECWWSENGNQFSKRVIFRNNIETKGVVAAANIMNSRIPDLCFIPEYQQNSSVVCYNFPNELLYYSSHQFNYATRLIEARNLMSENDNALCATEVRSRGKLMRLSCVSKDSKSSTGFSSVFSTLNFEDYGNVFNKKQTTIVYSNGRSLFCSIGQDTAGCVPLNQNAPSCQLITPAQMRSIGIDLGLENFQGKNECLELNTKEGCYREDGICYKWDY